MGGGFFDNMWDPYSGAYAYPRTQPRARYYRPQASVYEQRPAYDQHPVYSEQRGPSRVQPESPFSSSRVEEPSTLKTVRTIPVTDADVPVVVKSQSAVPQKVKAMRSAVRFESEDAAATKIQAVYRGYSVRRTEPLKHLRIITKVKEEFEGFRRKLESGEQRAKLCGNTQGKLRWTEGIMALLLRLDQLQGVHPEVRVIRKALAKELVLFQEKLDSISDVPGKDVEDDANIEETCEVCDAEEARAEVIDGDANIPAGEAVEEMEVEENVSSIEDVNFEDATQAETDDTSPGHQEVMEQDAAPDEDSSQRDHDSNCNEVTDVSTSEQHTPDEEVVTSIVPNPLERGTSQLSGIDGESMVKDAEQDCLELRLLQAAAEVPMDVENEALMLAPARDLEEAQLQAESPRTVPPMDVESDNHEPFGLNNFAGAALSTAFVGEPVLKEAASVEKTDAMENPNQSYDVGRDEIQRLTNKVGSPKLDMSGDDGDGLCGCTNLAERVIDAGSADLSDGWVIPASPTSLKRQFSAKSLQVGQPQISAASDTSSLSDRALLEQLLEENRKLKECVGKVLHWGKHQNDIIHNLACRIEQLEEHQPQPNVLPGEKINGRKRISNDVGLVGDRERSPRSKGRRKGKPGNKPQLGYLDSEWLSAESEEYF